MSRKRKLLIIGIILILLISIFTALAFFSNRKSKTTKTQNQTTKHSKEELQQCKGVTLSPNSFGGDDFRQFFELTKQTGNCVAWYGDWNDLAKKEGLIIDNLASRYSYQPLVVVTAFKDGSASRLVPIQPLTPETKQKYISLAKNYIANTKPPFFGIGIEVNRIYETNQNDFNEFVNLFNQTAAEIKNVSAATKIFTVFQLEKMKGLQGGLFGGKNNSDLAQWQLLKSFEKADFFAFSTYPGIIFKDPNEIPADYYSEIKTHTSKEVAFTEIGWFTTDEIKGWESSEAEQAEFINKFFELTNFLNPKLIIWSFMFDQNTPQPFTTMGIIGKNSQKKLGWDQWVNKK